MIQLFFRVRIAGCCAHRDSCPFPQGYYSVAQLTCSRVVTDSLYHDPWSAVSLPPDGLVLPLLWKMLKWYRIDGISGMIGSQWIWGKGRNEASVNVTGKQWNRSWVDSLEGSVERRCAGPLISVWHRCSGWHLYNSTCVWVNHTDHTDHPFKLVSIT